MRERVLAFSLSAFIVGFSGALYAHQLGAFAPSQFYLDLTFLSLAMLVVGGITTLSGAVVGTLVVSSIEEILNRLESGEGLGPVHLHLRDGIPDAVLALLVLIVMIVRREGLIGERELSLPRFRRQVTGEESA